MKRRFFTLTLVLLLLCTVGIPAIAVAEDTGFSDVPPGVWYADAVAYVAENGLMSGTSATTFSPHTTASRAMLVAILYRRAGSPTVQAGHFSDVPANAWYSRAAGWAATNGIVSGYGDGRFAPSAPVTREQLAAILWRAAGSHPPTETALFADQLTISTYALRAVAWARAQGIISGNSSNRFEPKNHASRAELAVMLHRWLRPTMPTQPEEPNVLFPQTPPQQEEEATMPTLTIQVGSRAFSATLEDNETTRALLMRLPMTVRMGELNGNEKFYYLPDSLPTNSRQVNTLYTGDLMLYGGDCLVLFYETFSSGYSYTRLGSVDDPAGLAAALGRGSVEVGFQVN